MDGNLVRLRAYEKSDLDAIMKWVNDEEVTDLLGNGMLTAPVSSLAEEKFIAIATAPSDTGKIFAIETLADREYIGSIDLHEINLINRSAGLGIVIGDKTYWGRGYGTDALRVLMRLAFDKLNLHRLWLRVHDYNQRGIKSYEKCGFKREGVLRHDHFGRGRYVDVVVMAILENEYRALP